MSLTSTECKQIWCRPPSFVVFLRPSPTGTISTWILRDFSSTVVFGPPGRRHVLQPFFLLPHYLSPHEFTPTSTFNLEIYLFFLPSILPFFSSKLAPMPSYFAWFDYSLFFLRRSDLYLRLLLFCYTTYRAVPNVSSGLRAEFARGDGRVKRKERVQDLLLPFSVSVSCSWVFFFSFGASFWCTFWKID